MKNSIRSNLRTCVAFAALCATILTALGCTMPYGPQFRAAALPSIESGLQSILSGVLTGVFAAIAPEDDATENMANSG